MHILVGMPSPENSQTEFSMGNLQDILSYTRKTFPDWKISTAYRIGVRTDANRNFIIKKAIESGNIDYILWLDVDMLYPAQIIERYFDTIHNLKKTIDVIGCLYFKRSYPYTPVAYEYNKDDNKWIKPYKTVLPSEIRDDVVYEVDGLGYGGLMVNMKVYEKLGKKRWTVYGDNFHLPFDSPNHVTHDLKFCKDVKDAGMSIKMHGGVRPGHLRIHPVTIEDWREATEKEFKFSKKPPRVLVIMPTIDKDLGEKAAQVMRVRSGADCDIAVVVDDERKGFVYVVNKIAGRYDHELIVYTAQDAMVGNNWLKHAILRMTTTGAGLVAFNDGKWNGSLASFGMIHRPWVNQVYKKDILCSLYVANYADTELTQIAKQQNRYAYAEKAVMLEVDYEKALGHKGTNTYDNKMYKKRVNSGFDGKVADKKYLEEFA